MHLRHYYDYELDTEMRVHGIIPYDLPCGDYSLIPILALWYDPEDMSGQFEVGQKDFDRAVGIWHIRIIGVDPDDRKTYIRYIENVFFINHFKYVHGFEFKSVTGESPPKIAKYQIARRIPTKIRS